MNLRTGELGVTRQSFHDGDLNIHNDHGVDYDYDYGDDDAI